MSQLKFRDLFHIPIGYEEPDFLRNVVAKFIFFLANSELIMEKRFGEQEVFTIENKTSKQTKADII